MTPLNSAPLAIAFLVFCATLVRSLAVQAKLAAPLCGRCGHMLERRTMGDKVCRCHLT